MFSCFVCFTLLWSVLDGKYSFERATYYICVSLVTLDILPDPSAVILSYWTIFLLLG